LDVLCPETGRRPISNNVAIRKSESLRGKGHGILKDAGEEGQSKGGTTLTFGKKVLTKQKKQQTLVNWWLGRKIRQRSL